MNTTENTSTKPFRIAFEIICFLLVLCGLMFLLGGDDVKTGSEAEYESHSIAEWNDKLANIPRAITIRLGVDINIGEDKPAQLSADQDRLTNVDNCPEMEVYPKRPNGDKCITIFYKDGERYPINYVSGGVDIWTVNQSPEGKYTITRLNGKTVDLGLESD